MVFDREGYSPNFLAKMKERRMTYHKYPGEDWPRQEFAPTEVRLASGERTTFQLAERGTNLSNGLWVREFRKLSESGHQTAFLSTDYRGPGAVLAPAMFARWSQENFFRYMRQSFNLDGIVDYGTESIPETTRVVNPAHRALDGQVRSKVSLLKRKTAEFGAVNLNGDIEPEKSRPLRNASPTCRKPSPSCRRRLMNSKLNVRLRKGTSPTKNCPRRRASIV